MESSPHHLPREPVVPREHTRKFIAENTLIGDRFEDQWHGILWLLTHAPEEGTVCAPENHNRIFFYVFPGNPHAETHSICVVYSYSETQVTIYSVCQLDELPSSA